MDKKILGDVITSLADGFDKELFAKKQEELEDYWHFKIVPKDNIVVTTYKFYSALDNYKHFCERWEKHHNGICCIVERLRDKYIMPKIAQFYIDLKKVLTEEE